MADMESFEAQKNQIRCLISNVYDMQKLRIAAGNRITTSFYIKMGVNPSEKIDSAEEKDKKMIDALKQEYNRLADSVVANDCTIKKAIKLAEASDKELSYIKSEVDYKLMNSYMLLLKSEEDSTKVLDAYVKQHPMWDAFFKDIKGCGTLMSAMCLAYLDPYKARHVSCFFRYCGIDTVKNVDEDGNEIFITKDGNYRKVIEKYDFVDEDGILIDSSYKKSMKATEVFDEEHQSYIYHYNGNKVAYRKDYTSPDGVRQFTYIEGELMGETYVGEVDFSEHGRRMGDTEMFEYTAKDGTIQQKRGITYNKDLKTKLMGVLTGCLIKAKDPVYTEIYYGYRKRLDAEEKTRDYTDGHKNMMAQRYMIKQFLRNLWVTWRMQEGLYVDAPYEEAKLHHAPHKYNQYQSDMAKKCREMYGNRTPEMG